jgi:hypothetical protein
MSKEDIEAINKYCSPDSLLIVTIKGDLTRLFCPFDVIVIDKIDVYVPGQVLKVPQVKMDSNLILVYIIKGKGYNYFNFAILIG